MNNLIVITLENANLFVQCAAIVDQENAFTHSAHSCWCDSDKLVYKPSHSNPCFDHLSTTIPGLSTDESGPRPQLLIHSL